MDKFVVVKKRTLRRNDALLASSKLATFNAFSVLTTESDDQSNQTIHPKIPKAVKELTVDNDSGIFNANERSLDSETNCTVFQNNKRMVANTKSNFTFSGDSAQISPPTSSLSSPVEPSHNVSRALFSSSPTAGITSRKTRSKSTMIFIDLLKVENHQRKLQDRDTAQDCLVPLDDHNFPPLPTRKQSEETEKSVSAPSHHNDPSASNSDADINSVIVLPPENPVKQVFLDETPFPEPLYTQGRLRRPRTYLHSEYVKNRPVVIQSMCKKVFPNGFDFTHHEIAGDGWCWLQAFITAANIHSNLRRVLSLLMSRLEQDLNVRKCVQQHWNNDNDTSFDDWEKHMKMLLSSKATKLGNLPARFWPPASIFVALSKCFNTQVFLLVTSTFMPKTEKNKSAARLQGVFEIFDDKIATGESAKNTASGRTPTIIVFVNANHYEAVTYAPQTDTTTETKASASTVVTPTEATPTTLPESKKQQARKASKTAATLQPWNGDPIAGLCTILDPTQWRKYPVHYKIQYIHYVFVLARRYVATMIPSSKSQQNNTTASNTVAAQMAAAMQQKVAKLIQALRNAQADTSRKLKAAISINQLTATMSRLDNAVLDLLALTPALLMTGAPRKTVYGHHKADVVIERLNWLEANKSMAGGEAVDLLIHLLLKDSRINRSCDLLAKTTDFRSQYLADHPDAESLRKSSGKVDTNHSQELLVFELKSFGTKKQRLTEEEQQARRAQWVSSLAAMNFNVLCRRAIQGTINTDVIPTPAAKSKEKLLKLIPTAAPEPSAMPTNSEIRSSSKSLKGKAPPVSSPCHFEYDEILGILRSHIDTTGGTDALSYRHLNEMLRAESLPHSHNSSLGNNVAQLLSMMLQGLVPRAFCVNYLMVLTKKKSNPALGVRPITMSNTFVRLAGALLNRKLAPAVSKTAPFALGSGRSNGIQQVSHMTTSFLSSVPNSIVIKLDASNGYGNDKRAATLSSVSKIFPAAMPFLNAQLAGKGIGGCAKPDGSFDPDYVATPVIAGDGTIIDQTDGLFQGDPNSGSCLDATLAPVIERSIARSIASRNCNDEGKPTSQGDGIVFTCTILDDIFIFAHGEDEGSIAKIVASVNRLEKELLAETGYTVKPEKRHMCTLNSSLADKLRHNTLVNQWLENTTTSVVDLTATSTEVLGVPLSSDPQALETAIAAKIKPAIELARAAATLIKDPIKFLSFIRICVQSKLEYLASNVNSATYKHVVTQVFKQYYDDPLESIICAKLGIPLAETIKKHQHTSNLFPIRELMFTGFAAGGLGLRKFQTRSIYSFAATHAKVISQTQGMKAVLDNQVFKHNGPNIVTRLIEEYLLQLNLNVDNLDDQTQYDNVAEAAHKVFHYKFVHLSAEYLNDCGILKSCGTVPVVHAHRVVSAATDSIKQQGSLTRRLAALNDLQALIKVDQRIALVSKRNQMEALRITEHIEQMISKSSYAALSNATGFWNPLKTVFNVGLWIQHRYRLLMPLAGTQDPIPVCGYCSAKSKHTQGVPLVTAVDYDHCTKCPSLKAGWQTRHNETVMALKKFVRATVPHMACSTEDLLTSFVGPVSKGSERRLDLSLRDENTAIATDATWTSTTSLDSASLQGRTVLKGFSLESRLETVEKLKKDKYAELKPSSVSFFPLVVTYMGKLGPSFLKFLLHLRKIHRTANCTTPFRLNALLTDISLISMRYTGNSLRSCIRQRQQQLSNSFGY